MRHAWLLLLVVGCKKPDSEPKPAPIASGSAVVAPKALDAAPPPADPLFTALEERAAKYKDAPDGDLVPYRDKDKWGFADRTGKIVIAPKYDFVGWFKEGRAAVYIGEQCGIIDGTGYEVMEVKYPACADTHDKHTAVTVGTQWIVVDKRGKPVVHEKFDGLARSVSNDGMITVRKGELYGWIGHDGKQRVDFTYKHHNPAGDGRIPVSDGTVWGAIDYTGKVVIPLEYEEIQPYYGGLALARKNNKWGVIDVAGKVVVPHDYDFIHGNAKPEYIVAQKEFDKPPTILFDRTGKKVGEIPFNAEDQYADGLIAVGIGGKTGYVDITGKLVIPAKWDHANSFVDGLAWASNKQRGGFIDKTGKYVIKAKYSPAYDYVEFVDGIVDVRDAPDSNLKYFIDRNGREYLSADTRAWYAKKPIQQ